MSEEKRIEVGELSIAGKLHDFVGDQLLPGLGVSPDDFWRGLTEMVRTLGPRNRELLEERDRLQSQIDAWHKQHREEGHDAIAYRALLEDIGYLSEEVGDFQVSSANIDDEISTVAGPQLVVPLDNARYVLNAANARWGSLYNALYATDAISEAGGCARGSQYNPIRGDKVIAYVRSFLDRHFGLEHSTHHHATCYRVANGQLVVRMGDGSEARLLRPERFVAFDGEAESPASIVLRKNGLHVELKFGEGFFIGRRDHANIYDVIVESALTTIMDCEDSVAAVDVDDKLEVYGNWLGLMKGTLTRTLVKGDKTIERKLDDDRHYTDPNGDPIDLPGRSLMLVRNVGSHLYTDMVTCAGQPIAETMLDALVTSAAAKHDLLGLGAKQNSTTGSIYIVKPKMHGPQEVEQACRLFSHVEAVLGLEKNTLKMGIMDEERRTSLTLQACISIARDRLFFINTGFLDRTGDEIHTAMEAGPVLPKTQMKSAKWLLAYEDANVDVGLRCGLMGRAQIGKGMWAMPDEMAAMLETKIGHPKAGANTAWVPSPTAATLHALHYHLLEVSARQHELSKRPMRSLDDMLALPLMEDSGALSDDELQRELDNNAQGILGYVARWVGQGVGCSKVADINDIALMEDCATLRISSQHIANWLHHGLLTEAQVRASMERMAVMVDFQNASDPAYQPMSANFEASIPFQAALDLVFKGREQPNGYTEFILQSRRREMKAAKARH